MSIEKPNNNNATNLSKEKSKATNSGYEVPKQSWGWLSIGFAIAIVMIPPIMWLFPEITPEFALKNDTLIKVAIAVGFIAIGIKINTWIKNKSEAVWESSVSGNSGNGSGGANNKSKNSVSKGLAAHSKPLTKSSSSDYGKFKPKDVGQYRHESMIKDDKGGGAPTKSWGGSSTSSSNNSARFSLKKPSSSR